jgi:hypothetical protein
MYAYHVINDRWADAEKTLLEKKDIDIIIDYASKCIKKRWHEAEDIIIKEANRNQIVHYVTKIGERWEEVEPIVLAHNSSSVISYANNCIKGRWIEGEKRLLETTHLASKLEYCETVLKGRWKEFEDILFEMENTSLRGKQAEYIYEYAKNVIKGKLPETLHNKMIMTYSMNRDDEFLIKYFKAKKYKVEKENKIKLYKTAE